MPKRHRAGDDLRSAVRRIEELILASSGADAFELVLALVAARLASPGDDALARGDARAVRKARDEAARAWPWLDLVRELEVPD